MVASVPQMMKIKTVTSFMTVRGTAKCAHDRIHDAANLGEQLMPTSGTWPPHVFSAALHSQSGVPLIPGKDTIVALRTERTLLDASTGYELTKSIQDTSAISCYKFIDNSLYYTPRELSILLRSLQNNPCKSRESFFKEVRTN